MATPPDLKDVFASAHEHAERTAASDGRRPAGEGPGGNDDVGCGGGAQSVTTATTVSSVLLRHGIMPDYRAVESSRDAAEVYASRLAREGSGGGGAVGGGDNKGGLPDRLALPQSPGASADPPALPPSSSSSSGGGGVLDGEATEHAVALHALFAGFCHPAPSYGGVAGACALERARVASLRETEGAGGPLDAAGYLSDGRGSVPLNR